MSLKQVLDAIRDLGTIHDEIATLKVTHENEVRSPVSWQQAELEQHFDIQIPEEIVQFWDLTSGVRLYEEMIYNQWGLILYGSDDIQKKRHRAKQIFPEHIVKDDLVIGEYIGDPQLVIVRCNPEKEDFGHIMIAIPMSGRDYWIIVAKSLEEFLSKSLESSLEYYWEKQ